MIRIHPQFLRLYQTNCYILHREGAQECVVIDPGCNADTVMDRVAQLGLRIAAILLTHGHFDHVSAVRQIAADVDCPVFIHEQDLSLPANMTAGPLYYTDLYPASGKITAAGIDFLVLHTPGHTPGSVCLLAEDILLSGDTLFAGSMGRCDFPGSSLADMRQSLAMLKALPGDYRVFPGHMGATTLEHERKTNPFLR